MNTCVICKKEFEIRHHLAVNRQICYNKDCKKKRMSIHYRKHRAKIGDPVRIPKTVECINCGLEFTITNPKKLHSKICSDKCKKERQQEQLSIFNLNKYLRNNKL